jgi:hypothetical protein
MKLDASVKQTDTRRVSTPTDALSAPRQTATVELTALSYNVEQRVTGAKPDDRAETPAYRR